MQADAASQSGKLSDQALAQWLAEGDGDEAASALPAGALLAEPTAMAAATAGPAWGGAAASVTVRCRPGAAGGDSRSGWVARLPGTATAAAAASVGWPGLRCIAAVGCEDGELHVLAGGGRRACRSLALGAPVVAVCIRELPLAAGWSDAARKAAAPGSSGAGRSSSSSSSDGGGGGEAAAGGVAVSRAAAMLVATADGRIRGFAVCHRSDGQVTLVSAVSAALGPAMLAVGGGQCSLARLALLPDGSLAVALAPLEGAGAAAAFAWDSLACCWAALGGSGVSLSAAVCAIAGVDAGGAGGVSDPVAPGGSAGAWAERASALLAGAMASSPGGAAGALLDALSDAEAMQRTAEASLGRAAAERWQLLEAALVARAGDEERARALAEGAVGRAGAAAGGGEAEREQARRVVAVLCGQGGSEARGPARLAAEAVLERAVADGTL